jgi:hypothetical protein
MGSDNNNDSNNYYMNQNSNLLNFYERIQQPNASNNEWVQSASEIDATRQNNCLDSSSKNSDQQKNKSYNINNSAISHNQHNWNFPSNSYRLYNDNPYGIILSSTNNSSTQQVSTFIPSSSSSSGDNNSQNTQQPHQNKRVYYQGLNEIQYKKIVVI